MKDTNRILYLFLFVLALGVAFSGINIKFITDDPGLYASIAKNLQYKNSFFQLFTYNQNWLDKPHFPFWCILLSFKLFGVSTWAYRLPGLIFFIVSAIYTYLFARRYYGSEIAATAVLILTTAQHILLSNTDLRAEPYLMALIIGSIYHISKLEERFTFANLFLTALLTACAIMTKGIFVIGAIYGSLIGQLFFRNELRQIFSFRWLWLLLLTIVFTLPEFYALYMQFDMHPEKIVFGKTNVSGIKWFLWDSQFGRFVNNGPITRKAQGSVFFYLHTLLWAFAPWCLLFYYAVGRSVKSLFDKQRLTEYYSLSGGLFMLALFSLSRFQLPFYTNAVFPLFAIVTAPICINKLNKTASTFRLVALWLFVILLPVTVLIVNFFLKPVHNLFFGIDCILFGVLILLVPATIKEAHKKAFFLTVTSALFVGFYLNTVFYNQILPYNGQIAAADYVNLKPFNKFKIYSVKPENNIFQFYCKRPVELVPVEKFSSFKSGAIPIFYINQASFNYLKQTHANFRVIRVFLNYPQENILPKFVDKTTRYKVLDHVYLITK
jgi:4-amino-4-deoxy-L-arabinose transferase-like glycosyltransferase